MTDPKAPPQPPIAIRITRPYATEDEFLAREVETLTRTSILLLGAQSRPQGVVLRFELALASGAPLVRGEGRVTSFKEAAFEGMSGLTLRFTRLDSKSKALVDRAAALRDARGRPSVVPSAMGISPSPPAVAPLPPAAGSPAPPPVRRPTTPPPIPRPPTRPPPGRMAPSTRPAAASRPPPPAPPPIEPLTLDLDATRAEVPVARARSERPPPVFGRSPSPPSVRPQPAARMPAAAPQGRAFDLESTHAEAPRSKSQRPPVEPVGDREAVLERLRARARGISTDAVHGILEAGRRRRASARA